MYVTSQGMDGRDDNDGRRIADKKYGYIHPCATYPTSDIEIEIPTVQRS